MIRVGVMGREMKMCSLGSMSMAAMKGPRNAATAVCEPYDIGTMPGMRLGRRANVWQNGHNHKLPSYLPCSKNGSKPPTLLRTQKGYKGWACSLWVL